MLRMLAVGGAGCAMRDAAHALELCQYDAIAAVNDMIPLWLGRLDYAVTLHPENLAGWLGARARAGGNRPEVWSYTDRIGRRQPGVDRTVPDLGGSSGLHATQVALEEGFGRVVLAGIPMDAQLGHITRGVAPWRASNNFRRAWVRHAPRLATFVRSLSGWTRELLGEPTPDWLAQETTP